MNGFDQNEEYPIDSNVSSKVAPSMLRFDSTMLNRESSMMSRTWNGGLFSTQEYLLKECKKLILQGKYVKAFQNQRRHLIDADVRASLMPEYCSQVVHTCLKLVERKMNKPNHKFTEDVSILLGICNERIAEWEGYLQMLQASTSAAIGSRFKHQSSNILGSAMNSWNNSPEKTPTAMFMSVPLASEQSARFGAQKHRQIRNFDDNDIEYNDKIEESEQSSPFPKQGTPSSIFRSNAAKQTPPSEWNGFQQQQELQQVQPNENNSNNNNILLEESQDSADAEGMQKIMDNFHVHRELFLNHLLKTLYTSYHFYKATNQPELALRYLTNASEVIQTIVAPQLFIASAELSRTAAYINDCIINLCNYCVGKCRRIESQMGHIFAELNRKSEAYAYYRSAQKLSENAIKIWLQKLDRHSDSVEFSRLEIRFSNTTKELMVILFTCAICEESLGDYKRYVQTLAIGEWLGRNLLIHEPDCPVTDLIREQLQAAKEKYAPLLIEDSEIARIIRQLFHVEIAQLRIDQEIKRSQRVQQAIDAHLFDKADCKNLNQNLAYMIRKKQLVAAGGEPTAASSQSTIFDLQNPEDDHLPLKKQKQQQTNVKTYPIHHNQSKSSSSLAGQSTFVDLSSLDYHHQHKANQVLYQQNNNTADTILINHNNTSSFNMTSPNSLTAITIEDPVRHHQQLQQDVGNTHSLLFNSAKKKKGVFKSSFTPSSSTFVQIPTIHEHPVNHRRKFHSLHENPLSVRESTNNNNSNESLQHRQSFSNNNNSTLPVQQQNSTLSTKKLLGFTSNKSSKFSGTITQLKANEKSDSKPKRKASQGDLRKSSLLLNDIYLDNPPAITLDSAEVETIVGKSSLKKAQNTLRNQLQMKHVAEMIDLDACMSKHIQDRIHESTGISNYPLKQALMKKALHISHMDKRAFDFAQSMVAFRSKNNPKGLDGAHASNKQALGGFPKQSHAFKSIHSEKLLQQARMSEIKNSKLDRLDEIEQSNELFNQLQLMESKQSQIQPRSSLLNFFSSKNRVSSSGGGGGSVEGADYHSKILRGLLGPAKIEVQEEQFQKQKQSQSPSKVKKNKKQQQISAQTSLANVEISEEQKELQSRKQAEADLRENVRQNEEMKADIEKALQGKLKKQHSGSNSLMGSTTLMGSKLLLNNHSIFDVGNFSTLAESTKQQRTMLNLTNIQNKFKIGQNKRGDGSPSPFNNQQQQQRVGSSTSKARLQAMTASIPRRFSLFFTAKKGGEEV